MIDFLNQSIPIFPLQISKVNCNLHLRFQFGARPQFFRRFTRYASLPSRFTNDVSRLALHSSF
jgi:hypothetical protein